MSESKTSTDAAGRLTGSRIPKHLAVIPDGNRRWAVAHGFSDVKGHQEGFEVAKKLSRFCRRIGIHTVTVWGFSTENWRRDPNEVAALMMLYEQWIHDLLPEAITEEVRVVHLGRKRGVPEEMQEAARAIGFPSGMPESLLDAIDGIEKKTQSFDRNVINLAINYGGADEVSRAMHRLLEAAKASGVDPAEMNIENFLDTAGQTYPEPDLVWRTSGEMRMSGFLPIQSAYAEMVFTSKFFPELTEEDVVDAVLDFSSRTRRFGG